MNSIKIIIICIALTTVSIGLYTFANSAKSDYAWPLAHSEDRPKLLNFGTYVTPDPANNPISPPERFTGFHTGQDFEILPGEEDKDVPVSAICTGKILLKQEGVQGYGGLVTQQCTINKQSTTVVYGHLQLKNMTQDVGDILTAGTPFALLGAGKSIETDDNRKHLHLDIHKGNASVLLGYVQDEQQLQEFIDPMTVLGK